MIHDSTLTNERHNRGGTHSAEAAILFGQALLLLAEAIRSLGPRRPPLATTERSRVSSQLCFKARSTTASSNNSDCRPLRPPARMQHRSAALYSPLR